MIRVIGEVIESDTNQARVRLSAAGCSGCLQHCGRQSTVDLPFTATAGSSVAITTSSQPAFLVHTLMLPLAGFVAGVSVAAGLAVADGGALLLGLAGFMTGFLLCQRQSFKGFQIEEVLDE